MPEVPKPEFSFDPTVIETAGTPAAPVKPTLQSRVVTHVLRSLQYKFSVPENIYHQELKGLIWTPDDAGSGILVTSAFRTAKSTAEADVFPRVVVAAGGFGVNQASRSPIAVNGLHTRGNTHQGANHYVEIDGQIAVNAVSRGDYEALLLSEDVFMWLLPLEEELRSDLTLIRFEVSLVNGPTMSEQYKDCYVSSVGISWRSGMCWTTVPDGPAFADSVVHQ